MAGTGHSVTLEEKRLIVKVHEYMKKEQLSLRKAVKEGKIDKSKLPVMYNQVRKRTADALGISETTVSRVISELKVGELQHPKHSSRGRQKLELDSFSEGVVRRQVMEIYAAKQFPTLKQIHQNLQNDENFPKMSKHTLWRRMKKQLKFKFGRFQGKPVPMERDDIAAQRHHYLRSIKKYRREGYNIFYTDETWANEGRSLKSGWHIPEKEILGMQNVRPHVDIWLRGVGHRFVDGMIGGISSRPSGAGRRVIIVHIGSENGFLEGVGKVFIGEKNKKEDYHSDMNWLHFQEWFELVLQKIPDKSVIVVDQASYHKKITEETKNPTSSWRKAEIIDWLTKQNITLPDSYEEYKEMTVPQLRILAKQHKIQPKFLLEEMAEQSGKDIKILWLPVAHCELNAIELIWASVKSNIAKKNTTFKIRDVLPLCENELKNVTSELWASCVKHVKKLEDLLMERENIVEEIRHQIAPIIINIAEGDITSDSDSTDGSSSELE